MRPRTPSDATHAHDDLAFDAPSYDQGFDPSPDLSFDTVPDVAVDVVPDVPVDVKPRAKGGRKKPPLDLAPTPLPRPVAPPSQPLAVCLSCGASPPDGDDCPHDEVARFADASPMLVAAARKLQAAVQERQAQERALRRLVAAELGTGRGELDAKPPTLTRPAVVVTSDGAACLHCGHRTGAPRAARRKSTADSQGSFAFAARAEPAVADAVATHDVTAG